MTSTGSLVTGVIEENRVILDFGPYEGKSVGDIAELDPHFYEKLQMEKEKGCFLIRRQQDKSFRLFMHPYSSIEN